MVQSDSFSAWIEIEGVRTEEYKEEITEDEDEDGPVVTCWIASEEGKTFSVHFKDGSCSAPRWWSLSADGLLVDGRVLEPKRKGRPSEITRAIKNVPVSSAETRPLMFSKITTTDDDTYIHSPIDAKFGEITVSVWNTRWRKYRKGKSGTDTSAAPALGGPVHETCKKIGGHCINFGEPVRVERTKQDIIGSEAATHYWEYFDRLASFTFKYQPLTLLQADGIAPLPPAEPSSERSPEPVDTEEVDILRQQLQLIQKRLDEIDKPRGVKREPDAVDQKANKGRKRVKTEGQVPISIPGEVIDLT